MTTYKHFLSKTIAHATLDGTVALVLCKIFSITNNALLNILLIITILLFGMKMATNLCKIILYLIYQHKRKSYKKRLQLRDIVISVRTEAFLEGMHPDKSDVERRIYDLILHSETADSLDRLNRFIATKIMVIPNMNFDRYKSLLAYYFMIAGIDRKLLPEFFEHYMQQ